VDILAKSSEYSPLIYQKDSIGLICNTTLIIWDEAPMANQTVLSCVEETCHRIKNNRQLFGGIPIILLGDFHQTCPVIRKGTCAQIINASIKSSTLWPSFTIHSLTKPIRQIEDEEFVRFLNSIGEGHLQTVLLKILSKVTPKQQLIEQVFPDDILRNPLKIFCSILAPTNIQVNEYNDMILTQCDGEQHMYYATDTLKEAEECGFNPHDVDYIARHTPPGLPCHNLLIKEGCIYRLMHNFSIDCGLIKNAHILITHIGQCLITGQLIHSISGMTNLPQ
jgi:ATP-dependent DNA helicase PIF1